MKKGYGFIALVLISILLLSACTSQPSPTTTASKPTTTAAATTSAAPTSAPATSASAKPSVTTTTTAPSATSSGPVYGGILKYVRNTGIPAIGAPVDLPAYTGSLLSTLPVFEHLLLTDDNERIQPGLAESINISPDGKIVTLKMRQGIKFHDGTDFNAAAVKYNLEQDLAKNISGSAVLKNITSYDLPDPYTLKLNLTQFDARLLLTLAQSGVGQIASPTAIAKPTTPATIGKDHVVGTGSFFFDSWSPDQYIKFVKNPNYWQKGKPYLDGIEFRNNATITVSIMSFRAGELNMVENIDPADYVKLKQDGYAVAIPPGLAFVFSITPDSANKDSPFADLRMRQAIEYAIDKKAMADGIGMGTMNAADQLGSAMDPWYIKGYAARGYDPVKAKQLIKDAGYPNGLSYPFITDVRVREDQLTAVTTYLNQVGINTTLDKADVARYNTLIANGWKGILMPGFPTWSSFINWMNRYNNPTLPYPAQFRFDGWKDKWDAVVAQPDENKRFAQMQDLLKQIYDQALIIPYMWDSPRYVTDGTIQNMQWDTHHMNGYYNPAEVWLKPKK